MIVLYPCLTMLLQAEAPCDSVVPMPYLQYKECIESLQLSLQVNSIQVSTSLAVGHMRSHD